MQPNHFSEQVDHDLQWLAREAPQFHTSADAPRLPYPFSGTRNRDDGSDASDNESAGSDSNDDDPYHPYNTEDPSQKWVRDGDYVYAADPNLQNSYLAANPHMDDKPYVPQTGEQSKDKGPALFLSPDELAPSSSYDTYVYRDAAPQEPPQTLSPRDLTTTLPQNSPPAPPRQFRETSPARYARAYHVKRTIARVAAAKELSQVNSHDSDGEADASSGDDASEDEYVPSPRIRPRKLSPSNRFQPNQQQGRTKPRAAPRAAYSPYPPSSASATSASGSATECSSGAGSSRRAGSRNIQVIDQPPPPRGSWDKTGPNAYQCPWCDHIQRNKRSPDMERHIRSHFRRAADSLWVCCGLPPDEAAQYGVGPNENGWQFNGRYMVGGCHEDFSRMDALKRHWRNTNNSCIGAIQYARMEPTEPTQ